MKNNLEIIGDIVEIDIKVNGKVMKTIIDLADLSRVQEFAGTWYGIVDNKSGKVYCAIYKNRKAILLHRFIMGLHEEKDFVVDHVSHNTLDNRRSNLKGTSLSRNIQRKLETKSTVKKTGKHWGVFAEGQLIGEYETKKDALVQSIYCDREFFPELEQFFHFEKMLEKLGEQ